MTMTNEVEVWRSPDDVLREAQALIEEWRADARRRQRNRRTMRVIAAFIGLFATFLILVLMVNKTTGSVAASETLPPPTSAPLAAEFAPSPTTFPTPETIPPATVPGWTLVRVQTPGWDGQGKLLTDGERAGRDNRVLPGGVGVAIVAVDSDPSLAGTVVVEGIAWRVVERGKVPQNDISRFFRRPVEPVLVLISTLPGTERTYVEARL